jgi:hypothetical protein
MRKLALALAVLIGLPAIAQAQASVDVRIDLPFLLPRLVVVSPGVQVVPEVDEEVFFVDGHYWVRRDARWYRSRSHRSGWVLVPRAVVPARLVKIPNGKYRRWKPVPAAYRDGDRRHDHDHDRYDDRGRGRGHDDGRHDDRGRGRRGDRHDDRGHDDHGHGKHEGGRGRR